MATLTIRDESATGETLLELTLNVSAERITVRDLIRQRRFLIVRGELRTYKLHLGSGNILMEPDNQYLCIVPG